MEHGAQAFLWVAVLLLAAKLGTLVERMRLPAVLGEILIGVALGNLTLLGIDYLAPVPTDEIMRFLAELGAVILLFQLGLESNLHDMRRVGTRATGVALIGVIVPFVVGTYLVGPLLLPGLSPAAYLFLGAALTATSVGITGRVFRDMNCLQRRESQIVLGAAVIDDVLGLLILSVVSAIATRGAVSASEIAWLSALALGFLVGAVVVGQLLASQFSRIFARLHAGHATKLAVAVGMCLIFAYVASTIGLAPIVGAFAAGLVLDEAHFRWFDDPTIKTDVLGAMRDGDPHLQRRVEAVLERHAKKHLEQMIEPLGHMLVPIFFVMAGMQVRLDLFFEPMTLAVAAALTAAAVAGKLVSGLAAGPGMNRWLVGWGMVPRGEVGLIFAYVGKSLGVVTDAAFSVIVMMVVLTSLITPPVLAYLLRPAAVRHEPAPARRAADHAG